MRFFLFAFFATFFCPKTEISPLATGLSEVRHLYLNTSDRAFIALGERLEKAIDVEEKRGIRAQNKVPFYRKLEKIENTTIFVLEKKSTPHHTKHLFHLLEHLIGLWNFKGEEYRKKVSLFLFVGDGSREDQKKWEKENQIHSHLIKALFPNAEISYWKLFIQKHKGKVLLFDHALISDRSQEKYKQEPFQTERYLGGFFQKLEPKKITSFANYVQSYAKAQRKKRGPFKVSYVTRQGVRTLDAKVEKQLLQKIKKLENLELNIVDFAKMSFPEQVRIASETDVLIGVHGNGLSHTLFLPQNATLIELFPENTHRIEYALFAHLKNLHYYGWEKNHGWMRNGLKNTRGATVEKPIDIVDIEGVVSILEERLKEQTACE